LARSKLTDALLETADDMHRLGILDAGAHQKITARHLRGQGVPTAVPMTASEIKALRYAAHLSQAAFARYLNLTTGYVSQLERGTKSPTGAVLALLNVIRRNGVDVLL